MTQPPPKTFMGKIGGYLFGDEEAAPSPHKHPATEPPKGAQRASALPERLPAGTMQLIGLGGVKQQLGDKWGQRSEQIIGLVEGIYRRRLDATDVFYKVDDENYLILFTRLGRQEAAFKAKVIADEIQKQIGRAHV